MADSHSIPESDAGRRLLGLLRAIEERALANALGLPEQKPPETAWEGVLFSVGGRPLVAPLEKVKEILNYPSALTAVPGTKSWINGVANIRGNLLPIMDLQAFLFGRATVPGRRSRVLVVGYQGVVSGLLVDQMVGIRHFQPSDRTGAPPEVPEVLRPYVESAFLHDGEYWPVFSVDKLVSGTEFQFAAA